MLTTEYNIDAVISNIMPIIANKSAKTSGYWLTRFDIGFLSSSSTNLRSLFSDHFYKLKYTLIHIFFFLLIFSRNLI